MSFNRKAPDLAKRKKKLTRLSGLTETLIAPALVKKGTYLKQLIAHWPEIAGPYAAWAKPADIHPALSQEEGDETDGTLTLSIHSGRGPEAMAVSDDILMRVNSFVGFKLVGQLRVRQDLPLRAKSQPKSPSLASESQPKATSLQEALFRLGATIDAKAKK